METIIYIKSSEFNIGLFNKLKAFLEKDEELEIKVVKSSHKTFLKKETREESKKRIDKAIEDVEKGENLVSFTAKEFDAYIENLLKQ